MLGDMDFAVAYFDYILIKSWNHEEHTKHVKLAFKKIKEYCFKLSINKYDFFNNNEIPGTHDWWKGSKAKRSYSYNKKNMPPPLSVTILQAFWGFTNNYKNIIPKIHALWAPLNHLLKKDTKWNWSCEC